MDEEKQPGRPEWQAEKAYPELCQLLDEGLREIKDPEIGMDVIQLGLIRDVVIEPEKAHIRMILTTPFCPYAPAMMDMTRNKAETILNRPTTIELGHEAWEFSMMEGGGEDNWGLF